LINNKVKNKPILGLYLKLWLICSKYLKMNREKVHIVDVFWDGPIAGAANFNGSAHYFDVVEDDIEFPDSSLNFMLISLSDEILQLIIKNADIRLRWQEACDKDEADLDSAPALPEDIEQMNENKYRIDTYLYQNNQSAFVKRGIFNQLDSGHFEVLWF
jgi:hypothetical protein